MHTVVTDDGMRELGRYLTGVRAWMKAAALCLEVKP